MRFVFIIIAFICYSSATVAQTTVQQLLTEQQSHPIGIATTQPRFSWQLASAQRGVKQLSYEILVASSRANLEQDKADIWQSGEVRSDLSILIPYTGKPLASNVYYYWKVKVKTSKGETIESKPVFFTVGFVDPKNWKAKWIGYDKAFAWDSVTQWSRLSARYYRKEFGTAKKIKKAYVNLVGLGMYELMINGKKIGDQVLAPAPTDYRKTVLSNTFDVTEHIIQGKNAIGVALGNGRFFTMRQNFKPQKINTFGFPKLLLQLDMIFEDGTGQTIITDETWRFTADGPIRTNNEYDGEEYDATKELGNWAQAAYNDAKWLKANIVPAPTGVITPQPNRHMKIMQRIQPVAINKINGDKYILDMGQNFAGWLQLKVKGEKGRKVMLRFAESLQQDGELYTANLRDAKVTDVYTLKGEGEETWHPTFVYHGFRYVEITGWPGMPATSAFEGHLVYDQMQSTGNIRTANETINNIVKNAWWGIASNYKGMPVDCPQRNERQPWLGDRTQGAYGESFLFNNGALYAKWLDDIQQAQTAEGAIPDVTPAYWNYYSDNVTWPGAYILIAEMLYHQFGDQQVLVKHYPSMKKWMDYMRGKYLKNNILTKDKYGDWCVPPEDLKMIKSQDSTRTTNGQLIATAYYYWLLQIMKNFAVITGNKNDTLTYVKLSADIKDAFNKKFFKADAGLYDNGTITANLLPLYFGIVPANKKMQVVETIARKLKADNMHISTGVIGTQWLMRGLTQNGLEQAAFTLASNNTYPSWGYMIQQGATTIWELWNGNTANPQMNSQNHVMLLGDLLTWLYEEVAGIKNHAQSVAFKTISMKPALHQQLPHAQATYQSPYGTIVSDWKNDKDIFTWKINIPANTTALVQVPVKAHANIMESGRPANTADGLRFVKQEKGYAIYEVQSGEYAFESK